MSNFNELGLSASTLAAIKQLGFENPTPVQAKAIPILLNNNPTDFIGLAQTGTGKTAAFGLPLIELIDAENKSLQALIMAPTRELTQQTATQLSDFSKGTKNLNVEVVYGGAAISNQIRALRQPTQIVVATPGRLLDLIERKAISLKDVRYVVLDEADEMLNMGFKEAIDEILSFTPKTRVTWLFSATMPSEIRRIVKKYMDAPLEVHINSEERVNKDIAHKYVTTKNSNKILALRRFLDIQPDMRGIMFCRTRRETQQIADDLGNMGYGVEALHGDLSQGQRDAVMKRFKNRAMQLLIATDVAARGIDVNDLTHVIHHNLPDQLEGYTHRSGRTARAGKKGISLALISPRDETKIFELERKFKVKFEKIEIPSIVHLKSSRINHWANLIINTKVDNQAEKILSDLHGQFQHLTKEDILMRLITTQLDHLNVQSEDVNLNEKQGKSERSGKSHRDGRSGNDRYFINVGSIDGMTEPDLIHFISDVAGIDRNAISSLSLQKNCAFFNVSGVDSDSMSQKFKGKEIDGRFIRVNRDDEGRKDGGGGGRKDFSGKRKFDKSGKGRDKKFGGSDKFKGKRKRTERKFGKS